MHHDDIHDIHYYQTTRTEVDSYNTHLAAVAAADDDDGALLAHDHPLPTVHSH